LRALRKWLPPRSSIHISVMDAPEIFEPEAGPARCRTLALHREGIALGESFSCIGRLLRQRLQIETKKPVFVLNDFVNYTVSGVGRIRKGGDLPRAGIAGRIYNRAELQQFL